MAARDTAPRNTLVVLLPGNPGEAALYAGLVHDLEEHGHEVVVSSHPQFLEPPADLLAYARHHAEATRRHLAAGRRAVEDMDVVLVGHSVGAYLAYLLIAHGLLPVTRVIMVFPFLARPVLSGRLLLRLAAWRPLFRAVVGLARALPDRLKRWLVTAMGAGVEGARVLHLLASPAPFASAAMARVELREIATRADASYLFAGPASVWARPSKLVVLLCPHDRWVSPRVAGQLARFAYRFDGPMSHSLVVDPVQRRMVAEALHRSIVAAAATDLPGDPKGRASAGGELL